MYTQICFPLTTVGPQQTCQLLQFQCEKRENIANANVNNCHRDCIIRGEGLIKGDRGNTEQFLLKIIQEIGCVLYWSPRANGERKTSVPTREKKTILFLEVQIIEEFFFKYHESVILEMVLGLYTYFNCSILQIIKGTLDLLDNKYIISILRGRSSAFQK